MRKPTLRSALIYPYISLVIILAVAVGALSYSTGQHAVTTVTEHMLKEIVSRISQAVDRHVVGSVATLETAFPDGMAAPESIETDIEAMQTRFWIATSLHIDPNNYVYYGNIKGQGFGLYRHTINAGELRVKFDAREHRKKFSIDGINASPQYMLTEEKLFDPRTRPWFKVAQTSQKDIWTSVYIDFGTYDLVATRARRVLGSHGELQGVVATDMPLKNLNTFVSNLQISANGIAFIIEPNGDLIASSCSPNIRQTADGQNIRINAADSGNFLLNEVYLRLKPLLKEIDDNVPRTFFFKNSHDQNISVAFEIFRDKAGLNWINVVALPDNDFLGDISKNVLRTIFIAILATCLVVVIGLSIFNWLSKDLTKLAVAVNNVCSGRLEEPIEIHRNDAIGTLADSFRAMQHRLQTDHLTGLPNRYAFEQSLTAMIESYQSEQKPFAVMFVDINDFKQINDRYGHETGDQALIEFAQRLRSNIRSGDLVARLGGDEFVFILKEISSSAELDPIIQQLDRALAAPLLSITAEKETYHAAIGVAQYPTDALSMKELLSVADNQMYTHKFSFKEARPGNPQDQNEPS